MEADPQELRGLGMGLREPNDVEWRFARRGIAALASQAISNGRIPSGF
jgi:hypothetical protein